MGEIIGFMIGWNLTLEYGICASAIGQAWSAYFESFLGIIIKSYNENNIINEIFFGKIINQYVVINVCCFIFLLIITGITLRGVKLSTRVTNVITTWNILLILTFIIAGCFYIDTNNWFDPCAQNQFNTYCKDHIKGNPFFGSNGVGGIFRATSLVFFSYIGFDCVTCLAEETKNPRRIIWGLLGTLGIATVLYIAVSLVLTGMVPYTALDKNSPLSDAFSKHNATFMSGLVSFGALTTTTATTFSALIGQPRIFYRMAMDGLFFKSFQNIKFGTLICGILCAIIGCFLNFNFLSEIISVGTLLAYVLVCSGVLILRYESNMSNSKNISILVCLYVIFCLMFSFALLILIINNDYNINTTISYSIIGLLGFILSILISLIFVIHYKYHKIDTNALGDIYLTPLLPFVPLAGIFVNCFMIASLEIGSFIRLIIWTALALLIYFSYGINHSKLNISIEINEFTQTETFDTAFLSDNYKHSIN